VSWLSVDGRRFLLVTVCFIRSGGLLQEGLHLLFVRLFVSNEIFRHFQNVVTYNLLEIICPVT
jgi:hypothetical protein